MRPLNPHSEPFQSLFKGDSIETSLLGRGMLSYEIEKTRPIFCFGSRHDHLLRTRHPIVVVKHAMNYFGITLEATLEATPEATPEATLGKRTSVPFNHLDTIHRSSLKRT